MRRTPKKGRPVSAETIARRAERGESVSRYFTNAGRIMQPIQRVNVDFTPAMLQELNRAAQEMNISRQAVIKTLVRYALDQHYLAVGSRAKGKHR